MKEILDDINKEFDDYQKYLDVAGQNLKAPVEFNKETLDELLVILKEIYLEN